MEMTGLHCTCGAPLNSRMVAESYPIDGGGHRRRRVCDACGGDAVSIEWVVGVKAGAMLLVQLPDDRPGRRRGPHPTINAVKAIVEANGGEVTRL
jgi:hypothetical protein